MDSRPNHHHLCNKRNKKIYVLRNCHDFLFFSRFPAYSIIKEDIKHDTFVLCMLIFSGILIADFESKKVLISKRDRIMIGDKQDYTYNRNIQGWQE